MKKLVTLLATSVAVCALTMGSAAIAGTSSNTQSGQPAGKKSSPSFSFVFEAAHGRLTQVAGTKYQLVIPLAEVKSILAFSNRPDRIAKQLSPTVYSKLIHSGNDSFDKNPPNMALTFGTNDSIAFEVTGANKSGSDLVYNLILLGNQAGPHNQSGHVSLFIDDMMSGVIAMTTKTN